MAEFLPAFDRVLLNEGGYQLTNIKGDRGRQTYAGVSRKANPGWPGWEYVDAGNAPPAETVKRFYRAAYWDAVSGDEIANQSVAESVFDFGVNAGVKVAVKLAQIVAGATPDGVMGPKSIRALNSMEARHFRPAYALAKLARYEAIVSKDRSQEKFLLGWVRRVLREAA